MCYLIGAAVTLAVVAVGAVAAYFYIAFSITIH
jgi:hypothetical protein